MKTSIVLVTALLICGCATAPTVTPDAKFEPVAKIKDVRPISAIVVTECGLAVALYIQLDQYNLFRADPKQSELFTDNDGKAVHMFGAPMPWNEAYELAGLQRMDCNFH
jgi:hypothetical protein